jgi:sterol desaturase/sphingolipid hydroxylase (fatty acid hydroxylase superfamily)
VDEILTLVEGLRQWWRALLPSTTVRGLAAATIFFVFYYALVFVLERAARTRTGNYSTRGFAHDIAYYFYFKGGLQRLVVPAAFIAYFGEALSFLDFRLLDGLPFALKCVAWLLVADFVGYWVHRAKHHFGFLWAFHTTHHSQENVNFATFARVHPVEDLIGQFVGLFLLLMLGASPLTWFLIYVALDVIGELQHTQIPWRFGPLHWVLVTPRFHIYHHSIDPAHHDRNFGIVFSFWDRLFGTDVEDGAAPPTRFGLADVKPTSLWATFVDPFRMLVRLYGPGRAGKAAAPDPYDRGREPG